MFSNVNLLWCLRRIINAIVAVKSRHPRVNGGWGWIARSGRLWAVPRRLATVVLGVGVAYGTLQAEPLTVQVTQGLSSRLSIAVVDFANTPLNTAAIVGQDLEHSGRFAALDKARFPQTPHALGEIDLSAWKNMRVDYVLVGQVSAAGEIDFAAVNVLTGQTLFHYVLAQNAQNPRRDAHRIANLVFEKVTGLAGAFDTKIAYVSVESVSGKKRWRLVVADYDGENPAVILDSAQPLMSPNFSADGAELAYVSFESQRAQIWVQKLATGERVLVSDHAGVNGAPAFSPDGRFMAFTLSQPNGNLDVYLFNRQNQSLSRVTDDPAIDTEAAFSPTGKQLVFTSDRAGRPQLYSVDWTQGGKPTRVSFEGPYNARARFSPDGQSVTLVSLDGGGYRVGVLDLTTQQLKILTNGVQDTSPSFAPNGQMIVYASKRGARSGLNLVSVDGVMSAIKGRDGDLKDPVWCPAHK